MFSGRRAFNTNVGEQKANELCDIRTVPKLIGLLFDVEVDKTTDECSDRFTETAAFHFRRCWYN